MGRYEPEQISVYSRLEKDQNVNGSKTSEEGVSVFEGGYQCMSFDGIDKKHQKVYLGELPELHFKRYWTYEYSR